MPAECFCHCSTRGTSHRRTITLTTATRMSMHCSTLPRAELDEATRTQQLIDAQKMIAADQPGSSSSTSNGSCRSRARQPDMKSRRSGIGTPSCATCRAQASPFSLTGGEQSPPVSPLVHCPYGSIDRYSAADADSADVYHRVSRFHDAAICARRSGPHHRWKPADHRRKPADYPRAIPPRQASTRSIWILGR